MAPRDVAYILILGALWGASFILYRVGAPQFGPFALAALRVAIATVFLLPFFLGQSSLAELKKHWKPLLVVGVVNTAAPFCLLAFATLTLAGGVVSIVNASTPLWGALIAWTWLKEELDLLQLAGLLFGFSGVTVMAWGGVGSPLQGTSLAIAATLLASLCYAVGAIYTRRKLAGVGAAVISTGSQVAATCALLPFAIATWPAHSVGATGWIAVLLLGTACTGGAYLLYFRLIASAGSTKALSVTYLVPAFAVLWGSLLIDEPVTARMITGCTIILLGTALATRVLQFRFLRAG